MLKTSLSTCHLEFTLRWPSSHNFVLRCILSILPKYTFLTIRLHKFNKIMFTDFEYRCTLQCFFIYWKNQNVLIQVFDWKAGPFACSRGPHGHV